MSLALVPIERVPGEFSKLVEASASLTSTYSSLDKFLQYYVKTYHETDVYPVGMWSNIVIKL